MHLIDYNHDDDRGGSVDLVCSDGESVLRARREFCVSRTPYTHDFCAVLQKAGK